MGYMRVCGWIVIAYFATLIIVANVLFMIMIKVNPEKLLRRNCDFSDIP